jgi:hypothetical protein
MFGGAIRFNLTYPGLNMQGRLWRKVRYEATTNQWFESLDLPWRDEHGTE